MPNKIQNFIFDLDGTIVDSSKEVLLCFKRAFDKANYQVDETLFTSDVIGPPLEDIAKMLAPNLRDEKKIQEVIKYYSNFYDYDENDISTMYEGLFEFLKKLKQNNKSLFIATLKPTTPTVRILKKFKIFDLFDDIYTIDKFGNYISKTKMVKHIIEKYNLKKEETIMLGDALSDILAGKENNITSVGALWGYSSEKTELKKNADFCIENIEELKQFI